MGATSPENTGELRFFNATKLSNSGLVGLSTESGFLDSIDNPGVEWLSIPALPSRTSASHVLGASREQLGVVLRRFLAEDAIRLRAGRWWVKKSAFMPYWERLRPLIESSSVAP